MAVIWIITLHLGDRNLPVSSDVHIFHIPRHSSCYSSSKPWLWLVDCTVTLRSGRRKFVPQTNMTEESTRTHIIEAAMNSLAHVPSNAGSLFSAGGHRYYKSLIDIVGPKASNTLSSPDIGHLAKWSVSSYKFGFGAECLRDDDQETFWQYVA